MAKQIEEVEFSIFDTETTGLDPETGDRIVELAAVRIKGKERLAEFQSLVNPNREISEAAFRVNKISSAMLLSAPAAQEVLPRFLSFIKGSCLCSYNAPFDMAFLNSELKLAGLEAVFDLPVVDALKMSRRLIPGLARYALWFVAESLGIKQTQEHRAFSDVEMTLGVFLKLRDILENKGVRDFEKFLGLFSIDPELLQTLNSRTISQIQEAIDLGIKVKLRYMSSSAQVTEREVLPKEIKQEAGRTYLVGFCCLRNDERSFRVDNILHLELL